MYKFTKMTLKIDIDQIDYYWLKEELQFRHENVTIFTKSGLFQLDCITNTKIYELIKDHNMGKRINSCQVDLLCV